jgi:hypothetical protein
MLVSIKSSSNEDCENNQKLCLLSTDEIYIEQQRSNNLLPLWKLCFVITGTLCGFVGTAVMYICYLLKNENDSSSILSLLWLLSTKSVLILNIILVLLMLFMITDTGSKHMTQKDNRLFLVNDGNHQQQDRRQQWKSIDVFNALVYLHGGLWFGTTIMACCIEYFSCSTLMQQQRQHCNLILIVLVPNMINVIVCHALIRCYAWLQSQEETNHHEKYEDNDEEETDALSFYIAIAV